MPSLHSIQKHQGSNLLRNLTWLIGGVSFCLFIAILFWLFWLISKFIFDQNYFCDLLWLDGIYNTKTEVADGGDKAAVGQFWGAIIGGVLAGGLTLLAAIIALGGALIQMQREANKDFLEWVVEFNHTFHADKDYGEVRQSLAENRSLFFKWMMDELRENADTVVNENSAAQATLELLEELHFDHMEVPEVLDSDECLSPVVRKNSGKDTINWKFVRKATDYLRFYEMVLLVAQRLPNFNNQQETFIGMFAWHIKWILCSWGGASLTEQINRRLAIGYYLAFNHFENLCSVNLCFLFQYRDKLKKDCFAKKNFIEESKKKEIERCLDIINEHTKYIYVIFAIQNAAKLTSEKHLTKYWIKILGLRGEIR